MNDVKMHPPSISIVISPPTIDLDSYDLLEHTCEEILSDEASFDSSFDDDPWRRMMDDSCDPVNATVDKKSLKNDLGHAKSPYFAPQNPSKKRTVSTRQIMRIDSESDDKETGDEEETGVEEETGDEEEANVSNTPVSVPSGRVIFNSKQEEIEALEKNRDLDEMEANAFAQVDEEVQGFLIRSISEHPFFKSDAYPVNRSERREFVNNIRQAATGAGLDESIMKNIIAYVKKLYLTASGWGHVCESGSEYGDEFDDEPAKITKSAKETKKDRKMKQSESDKSTDQASGKTASSANATNYQGLKSTDTKVHSEKTAKPVLDPDSSMASDPLSKTRETIHLDSSGSDESALSTPTKRRNNLADGDGGKRSRRPLSTLHKNPFVPSDSKKKARLSEAGATQRLTNEELPSQNLDSPRLDDPAVSKESSKKKAKPRNKRKSQKPQKSQKKRKTPKNPNSDKLQEPRMKAQKTSQPTRTVVPKQSKSVAAAQSNLDF